MNPDQPSLLPTPEGYGDWLVALKARIHAARQRAALAANRELVSLYWQIDRDILERQGRLGWGAKIIERLAHDLRTAFPEIKGFSRANLLYMRAFAKAWPEETIVQQLVGLLPWGHNLLFLIKLTEPDRPRRYALRNINKPMAIAEYQLTAALPDELHSSLPTIEQIERELGGENQG